MEQEKEQEQKINGYQLSRQWFDFAFENPDLINTNHCALWFWIVDLCNRLGWKEKFGLPTVHTMEALGIKSYNTFKATLNDLIRFGFICLIEKSKNQYTTNIIAISNFNKAPTKHSTKHNDIDKQLNNKTNPTIKPSLPNAFSIDYKPINGFDSLAFILWKQCYDNRIQREIKPTILMKARPSIWANEIKLMIESDERTEAEINEVLTFLRSDSFWANNILSPIKLRKQFETLQLRMSEPGRKVSGPASLDIKDQDYSKKLSQCQ